uniref:Inovirus Gp2 n=1 Tax=Myoviridae sp. ctLnO19 TaxID=2825085 RepID=A0A8S5P237_9CAUD|nr:MAG TPA: Inovirus Gp2 [Myoviridae sp. ctLnO19]
MHKVKPNASLAIGSEYINWTKEKLVSELLSLNLSSKFTLATLRTTNLNQLSLTTLRREYKLALSKQRNKSLKISRSRKEKIYNKLKKSRKDYFRLKRILCISDLPNGHYLRRNPDIVPRMKNAPYWLLDILQMNKTERRRLDYAYKHIKHLIRLLFCYHTKVVVIRMDLSMSKEYKNDLDKLNWCIAKLVNNYLRGLPQYLSYYSVREYTKKTGIHAHCYFFFDGSRSDKDLIMAKNIGHCWEFLSGGRWFSTNFVKEKLPDGGECLGTIEYWEIEKIERLLNNSKYLLKELSNRDWLVKLGHNENRRLFTASTLPADYEYLFVQHEALLIEDTSRKYRVSYNWLDNCKLCRHYSVLPHVDQYRSLNPLFRRGRPKKQLLH